MTTLAVPQMPRFAADLDASAERLDAQGIAIRRWGTGRPLVLFHGNHGSWLHWARCVPLLSAERSLYLIDLPGFGESANVEFTDFTAYSEALIPALSSVLPDGRVTIGGFSLGSIVALHLYPALRERVDRVIQVGAPSLTDGLNRSDREMIRWKDLPESERPAAHAHNLRQLMLPPDAVADDDSIGIQAVVTAQARLRMNRTSPGNRAHRIIRETKPVITAIWGEGDVIVKGLFPSAEARLSGLENGSTMHVIPGAAHWVQHEKPDEVARLILSDSRA
ncbi:hypothetical protein ATO6_13205 [Oceanicola sp. 22II-s10i]|uniref:alpha/beta fold hydrolase n=1 Tax=Oceanicola sp. 22II-s10i TaxID=1317116 RepID=UPI000B5253C3|nr:alpha/beta hydrolase [Oceanicola sp. 22II-s10i]OWU84615.1 hypothetical protein ATO6_13205 [Oceanicola sp. 22II-s10i]